MQFQSIQQRFIEPIENDLWLQFFYLAKLTKIQSRSSTPSTWPCFQWNPKSPILNWHHQFASHTSRIERSKVKIHEELSLQKTSGKSNQVKQTKQNRKEKNQKCSSSSNNFFFFWIDQERRSEPLGKSKSTKKKLGFEERDWGLTEVYWEAYDNPRKSVDVGQTSPDLLEFYNKN